MDEDDTGGPPGQQRDLPSGVATPEPAQLLTLVERLLDAERQMQSRTRAALRLGESDLAALRFVIKAGLDGVPLRQRELASSLAISSASTSALVDRLERTGFVRRTPHPEDRRSIAIETTPLTDDDLGADLEVLRDSVLDVAQTLDEDQRRVVAQFLDSLALRLQSSAGGGGRTATS